MIRNGRRARLIIDGVFDGIAGVQGDRIAFAPNRIGTHPARARGGLLDGKPVLLTVTKDASGPFWTARFEEIA